MLFVHHHCHYYSLVAFCCLPSCIAFAAPSNSSAEAEFSPSKSEDGMSQPQVTQVVMVGQMSLDLLDLKALTCIDLTQNRLVKCPVTTACAIQSKRTCHTLWSDQALHCPRLYAHPGCKGPIMTWLRLDFFARNKAISASSKQEFWVALIYRISQSFGNLWHWLVLNAEGRPQKEPKRAL